MASATTEIEETLRRIASHAGVEGVIICSRDGVVLRSEAGRARRAVVAPQHASAQAHALPPTVVSPCARAQARWRRRRRRSTLGC
jgi:hypothetical protein